MSLARLAAPFDHQDWMFEPNLAGFRAMAYVENGSRLIRRNGNTFKSFLALPAALTAALPVRNAILDGEIGYLGRTAAPLLYELMRRRTPQYFYAFDLLHLDERDLGACDCWSASGCSAGAI